MSDNTPFGSVPFSFDIADSATASDTAPTDVANTAEPTQDPEVIQGVIPTPESDDSNPCLSFPNLGIPKFNIKFPVIHLPDPHCCPHAEGRIIDTGVIAGDIGNFLSRFGNPLPHLDKTDPKVTAKPSPAHTLIGMPAEPPHVSVEVIKTIPNVALDLISEVVKNVLLAAGTAAGHIGGVLTMLKAKADALGDQAAKAMGNGFATVLTDLNAAESLASGAATAVWSSVNQALAMLPIRQIPIGNWHPLSAKAPSLEWFNDGQTRSKWPNNGKANDPLAMLNNGLNVVKDVFNASGAMCLVKAACNLFGGVCDALGRGLGLQAWGMQLEGMLRVFSVMPFNITGLDSLPHDWRHWCKLKDVHLGLTGPQFNSVTDIHQQVDNSKDCAASGSMPGNLMYAATGDQGDFNTLGSLANVAPATAVGLGSPYAQTIRKYVSDPDPAYDSLGKDLPDLFRAGDPRMRKLLDTTLAFQKVVILIRDLLNAEVTDLQLHATEVGGGFVSFVQDVRRDIPDLGDLKNLGGDFLHNRLTTDVHDLVIALVQQWGDLVVDDTVIHDDNRKALVHSILDPRDALGPTADLGTLMDSSRDILDNFGGHVGPEVAGAASVHAGLTRALLVANGPDTEDVKYARTKTILADAKANMADVTMGGAPKDYINTVADAAQQDVGFAGLARAGLPGMAASAKQSVDQLHRTSSALGTMMTQHNGKNLPDLHQPVNDIDHKAENEDTLNYTAAAQKQAADAAKQILTKSIPHVAASGQAFNTALITNTGSGMSDHMQRIIQESANGLATASLSKVTGTKLNQSFEGQVNQCKFMLSQAGHMMTHDAPFMRSTARVLISQGSIHLTEADTHQTRARWSYHVTQQATGFATVDYHVAASGTAHTVGNEIKLHGQKGIEIADQVKLTQAVGGPTAQAVHMEMGADGKYHVWALQEIVMHVGVCQMIIGPTRIDLNPVPTLPPVIPPTPILYTEAPPMETTPDKGVSLLPARNGRNPVPVASPYQDPGVSGGLLSL